MVRSDGTFVRDYIYVKDVVDAYLELARSVVRGDTAGEAFNFSTERPISVLEMVDHIRGRMDASDLDPRILDDASGEIEEQYLSAEKARERLDWSPQHSLDEGLDETIEWYRGLLSVEQ